MAARITVVVTGANTGLGAAIVRRLSQSDTYHLVATARGKKVEALREQFKEKSHVQVFELDLVDPSSRDRFVSSVLQTCPPVDVLINNAGISFRGVVEQMERDEETLQFETNYFGPLSIIRGLLPSMRKRYRGKIINISSVSGMMAMPTMGSYSASKFALEGASEALWYELKPWNISVSLIQLGFIKSQSYQNVYWSRQAKRSQDHPEDDYHVYYSNMSAFIARLMTRSRATPEKIACGIENLIQDPSPPLRVPLTFDAHLFFWIRRLLPRWLYHKILYRNLPSVSSWEQLAVSRVNRNKLKGKQEESGCAVRER
ncbi:MAG: SDR family NAD(P)-dependent oxidoreductase [Bdellovibrionales bacterium]|nr:SDR family NAD(P)-dependent oxidoreductase [Bdellovibrionales bacterium]